MLGHASLVFTDFTYSQHLQTLHIVSVYRFHALYSVIHPIHIQIVITHVHETMHVSLPHLAYQYIQSTDCMPFFYVMMYYIIGAYAQFLDRS